MTPLLRLDAVSRHFGALVAVDRVSFDIMPGECFGLVGESGSGKSTIAALIAGLDAPTSGAILLEGRSVQDLARRRSQGLARTLQMVFQDPFASLNPRKTVRQIVGLPLSAQRIGTADERRQRVAEALSRVGLGPEVLDRHPRSFSGGQRQRIAIARALVAHPRIIVADEPVSALDVSIRSQIINLLTDLKQSLGLSLFLISHDLSTIRVISDRIGVMYRGRIVELTDRDRIAAPQHPYTELLLSVLLLPHAARPLHPLPKLDRGDGPVSSGGCPFYARCPHGTQRCVDDPPGLRLVAGAQVACHHPAAERAPAGGPPGRPSPP